MNGERPLDSSPADDGDRALGALYAAHLGRDAADAARPTVDADARIRRLAHEAVERPGAAATVAPSRWRAWLDSSWFRPGLAFAAVASLSVVIVALMPRENLEVEREAVPAAPPPMASPPARSEASPAVESGAPPPAGDAAKTDGALAQKTAPVAAKPRSESSLTQRQRTATKPPSAPVPPASPPMPAAPSPGFEEDTPPGSPAYARTRPAVAPSSDLGTEPVDARTSAQPLPEVRDSVPTYRNEILSSIPPPKTSGPRAQARDAPAPPAAGGPAAAMRAQAMQKRSFEGLTAEVSPAHRDPGEWIKAIQKLRTEGKLEQVTKELAEFRKSFPAYAIPDELKPYAPK